MAYTKVMKCSSPKVRGKDYKVEVERDFPATCQGMIDAWGEETCHGLLVQAATTDILSVARQKMNLKGADGEFVYDDEAIKQTILDYSPGDDKPSFKQASRNDRNLAEMAEAAKEDPALAEYMARFNITV